MTHTLSPPTGTFNPTLVASCKERSGTRLEKLTRGWAKRHIPRQFSCVFLPSPPLHQRSSTGRVNAVTQNSATIALEFSHKSDTTSFAESISGPVL